MSKVYYEDVGNFKGKGAVSGHHLVTQIMERKPYVIGVQIGL